LPVNASEAARIPLVMTDFMPHSSLLAWIEKLGLNSLGREGSRRVKGWAALAFGWMSGKLVAVQLWAAAVASEHDPEK
jgi:hypothetical protein